MECLLSSQSRSLIHVFFAEREATKIIDVPRDTPVRDINKVAIIGGGTMGGGISMNFLSAGIPVTILEMEQEALDRGADIVICPRVTDAAVVIGPAAWKFNWQRSDFDALAGALTAGHIIECGCQACGGNYSFFQEVPSFRNVGYPIAEIEADGSFTITDVPPGDYTVVETDPAGAVSDTPNSVPAKSSSGLT